eukprot:UN18742
MSDFSSPLGVLFGLILRLLLSFEEVPFLNIVGSLCNRSFIIVH